MADDDVSVKFGAQIGGLQSGVGEAKSAISGFSEDVLKLNPHLVDALGNLDKAAEGAGKLSHATAGVTREFLVLGHEALTGNFSRMAGSSLVLANRMGVLQNIIKGVTLESVGWTAAITAIIAGVYEWAAADERLAQAEESIRGAMELNNQSLSYNQDIVEQNIERLRILADVSASTANEIGIAFARAGNLSVDLKNNLIGMVGDYAAATGAEAPKAAEALIKMFSDPKRGAEELARTFTGVLTPAQHQTIEKFADSGKTMEAQEVLFDALGAKIDDFRINHLTFLQKELERLRDTWVATFSGDLKLDTSSLEAAFKGIQGRSPELPSGQQDAAIAQEHQNQLNVALEKGYEIEQRSGLLVARRNELLEKQAGLVAAANAASAQGDSSSAARFTQDAAEVQEEINNLRAKGAKQDVEAEMQAIQEKLSIDKIYLGEKKDLLQAEVDAGKITKMQELEALKELTNQEYNLNSQALQDEINLSGLSVVERQRVNNEILTLQAQHERDMAALAMQEAAAQQAAVKKTQEEYKAFFDVIDRDMDQMLVGILRGTQSFSQAIARLWGNLATSIIEEIAKVSLKWAAFEAMKAVAPGSNAANALGAMVPNLLGGTGGGILGGATGGAANASTQALTTTITGNTTATASNSTGILQQIQSGLQWIAQTLGLTTTTVAQTTASTAAATASTASATATTGLIPTITANIAALSANTTALFASKAIPSFEVGTWSAPGGMALLHPGEIVLPPSVSAGVRAGTTSIGGGAGGGGMVNVNFSVNAVDSQSVANMFKNNGGALAAVMAAQMRNFNPNLRPS